MHFSGAVPGDGFEAPRSCPQELFRGCEKIREHFPLTGLEKCTRKTGEISGIPRMLEISTRLLPETVADFATVSRSIFPPPEKIAQHFPLLEREMLAKTDATGSAAKHAPSRKACDRYAHGRGGSGR